MVVAFLLENVPTVWLGLGLVVIAVGLSLLGLIVVRRHVRPSTLKASHDVAGFLIAIVGVIYAVLLGFVVVVVWEQFGTTDRDTSDEAAAVGLLYRDAVALGRDGRPLEAAVAAYGNSIVNVEWKYMADHQEGSPTTGIYLNKVWQAVTHLRARNATEADFVTNTITDLSAANEDRRTRIIDSSSEIPTPLWAVLIAGGLMTIAFTYFFGVESFTAQALMVSALATIIALSLLVILTLNLPFTGGLALKPDAMQSVIKAFHSDRF